MRASLGLLPAILFWGASYLIVNTVILGDPLAPLSVLGLGRNDWPFYPIGAQLIFLIALYPFTISFMGVFDTLGLISPIFLGFLPYFLVKEVRTFRAFPKELIHISLSALVALSLWIIVFGSIHILEVRYVLFLWMLLFLLLAQLMDNVMLSSSFARAGVQVILVMFLIYIAARTLIVSLGTYSPIAQNDIPQCHDLPMCTFFEPVNRLADPNDRVLVLSAYRYYLRPDLSACSSNKDDYLALEQAAFQSPNKFWDEVHRRGFRFIIYDSFFSQYILRFQNLPDLYTSLPPSVILLYDHTFKDYDLRNITESIYQIEQSPSAIPKVTCVFKNNLTQVETQ
jgi:hypothetical protein